MGNDLQLFTKKILWIPKRNGVERPILGPPETEEQRRITLAHRFRAKTGCCLEEAKVYLRCGIWSF
jgi:hypothetical protein